MHAALSMSVTNKPVCLGHATTTTSCLYRKLHHVLLQNQSCISSDRLYFSHPAIFQSQLHPTLHNVWHWAFPRSCSTKPGAWGLPGSRISTAGLPTGEQTPSTGAGSLFPPHTPTWVVKLIIAVSGGQWAFDSSEPLLVPIFCGSEGDFGSGCCHRRIPRASWWHQLHDGACTRRAQSQLRCFPPSFLLLCQKLHVL